MPLTDYLTPKNTLAGYLDQYAKEHTQFGTKLTHMVGIPMILASFPTAVVSPLAAGALFTGGWALQFIGHGVFEKKKPSFFSDPYYLAVGAVWVTAEWLELLRLPVPAWMQPAPAADEAADAPHEAKPEVIAATASATA